MDVLWFPITFNFVFWNSFVRDVQNPVLWLYFYWSPGTRQWRRLVPGISHRLHSKWALGNPHLVPISPGPSHHQAFGQGVCFQRCRGGLLAEVSDTLNGWTGQSCGLFREETYSEAGATYNGLIHLYNNFSYTSGRIVLWSPVHVTMILEY